VPKVLLFSRQPLAKRPLHEWLDDTAENIVLLTTPTAVSECPDVLAEFFPHHRLVEDYSSWVAEQAAEEAAREHGVQLVASTSEHDVLRAARLRERLGLAGQHTASAAAYRDKVVMKELAQQAGVPVPSFAAVDGPMDLLDFIDAHDFPVVVKPRLGAGAHGVTVLHGRVDLDAFLAAQQDAEPPYLAGQWMAETFVQGDFYHVDGMMVGGRLLHGWPSRYNVGVHEHVRDQAVLSSTMLSADDVRHGVLMRLTADVIAALPPTPMPLAFHLEAWIDSRGEPILCEIASRAGGGPIAEAYESCFGVQLAKEGLRSQCGADLLVTEQPAAPTASWGWVIIPPGHGVLVPPDHPCPVPGARLTVLMAAGAIGTGLRHATESVVSALVSAGSPSEVRLKLDQVVDWWSSNATWKESPSHESPAAASAQPVGRAR